MTDDALPGGLDGVRRILTGAEDVDLPEGMSAPDPAPQDEVDTPFDDDPYDGMDPDGGHDASPPDGDITVDPDILRETAGYPLNDLGNAMRFLRHFGADVMQVPRVGWFAWDDKVWAMDPDTIAVRRLAQRLSALILQEIPFLTLSPEKMQRIAQESALRAELLALSGQTGVDGQPSDDDQQRMLGLEADLKEIARIKASLSGMRDGHRRFGRATGNSAKIKAALLEVEVMLARRLEDLDAATLDVNTASGVLRFTQTPRPGTYPLVGVEMLPHHRDYLMTKMMTCQYDAAASAPVFHTFLAQVMPDEVMQRFLQRWFGYSMLGVNTEQALAFFYGTGRNGKGTLVNLLAKLFGGYGATAKIESLTGQNRRSAGDATPDLVKIVAARFVHAAEPKQGVEWQEELIKQLTGGDPILVRDLNEKFFEIIPFFKLTIQGNHQPNIHGQDEGIWSRLMIVPFLVMIAKADRDPTLIDKMVAEGPGILNWLIEGALAFLEGGLAAPDQIMVATEALRRDSDPYGKFLDHACVVTGDLADSITSDELKRCFMFWQMQRGDQPYRDGTIQRAMKDHSRTWRSPSTGKQFTARETGRFNGYDGVRLSDLFQRDWDAAPKDQAGKALSAGKKAETRRSDDGTDF